MGVYYYIVNRTLKQKTKKHYGKWGEFDFQHEVKGLIRKLDSWSHEHDIWAIGDNHLDSVKYYPKGHLPEDQITMAFEEYEEVQHE